MTNRQLAISIKSLSDEECIVAFGTPINLSEWTTDTVCVRIERKSLREEKRPTVLPGSDLAKTTARVTQTWVGYNSVCASVPHLRLS